VCFSCPSKILEFLSFQIVRHTRIDRERTPFAIA
jgi:hypothetical protein